jgi:hypothetical protein
VLSSISSDGERLCLSGYLGDGRTRNAPWGLVVVDLSQATAKVVLEGPDYCNMHPQYCRSRDGTASHDILVQHNHGCEVDEQGLVIATRTDKDPLGPDIHVVRDDGSHFRSLPWGRDGVEFSQGHQAWRGEQLSVVTSLHGGRLRMGPAGEGSSGEIFPLLEGWPMVTEPESQHAGKRMPGADRNRNDISRTLARPNACHFAFDPSGTKLISDTYGYRGRGATCEIYLGVLPAAPDAALRTRHLLYPKSSFGRGQHTHPHPFLSPDGARAFFNSDEPGVPHIWMVEGIEFPDV